MKPRYLYVVALAHRVLEIPPDTDFLFVLLVLVCSL
jgi:hypothetical protein